VELGGRKSIQLKSSCKLLTILAAILGTVVCLGVLFERDHAVYAQVKSQASRPSRKTSAKKATGSSGQKTAKHYTQTANRYNETGKYVKSIQLCKKAQALGPSNPEVYIVWGDAYYYIENHPHAVELYTRAIKLNSKSAKAYYCRARANASQRLYKQAMPDISRCLALDASYAEAYALRANMYRWLHRHEKSLKDSTKAIELNPKLAYAYYVRGKAHDHMFAKERARKDYERALKLFNSEIKSDPKKVASYHLRSKVYKVLGNQQLRDADERMVNKLEIFPSH